MWNGELDKKTRQAGQAEQIQIPVGAGRGVEDHRKKKGGMHGARLGITEEETGMKEHSKELGEGRRRSGAGTVLIRILRRQMTQTSTPGRADFFSRSQVQQLWHRAHTEGTGHELKPWVLLEGSSPTRRVAVDRACELLTYSVIATMRTNFKR